LLQDPKWVELSIVSLLIECIYLAMSGSQEVWCRRHDPPEQGKINLKIFYLNILFIIIIWCSISSGNVDGRWTPLPESRHRSLCGDCRLLLPWLRVPLWFFCNPGLKYCWHGRGFELTTLDLIVLSQAKHSSMFMTRQYLTA